MQTRIIVLYFTRNSLLDFNASYDANQPSVILSALRYFYAIFLFFGGGPSSPSYEK